MRKFLNLLFIIIAVSLLSGCGQPTVAPLYTWDNYVQASTAYGTKNQDEKVVQKYLAELKKIINESESKKQRVAPGLYAEYGQILFETNKKDEAKRYFILEKQTYPESVIFINRVMLKLYGESK